MQKAKLKVNGDHGAELRAGRGMKCGPNYLLTIPHFTSHFNGPNGFLSSWELVLER